MRQRRRATKSKAAGGAKSCSQWTLVERLQRAVSSGQEHNRRADRRPLSPPTSGEKKRTFPNRRFDSGKFDTPGDRVVAARVPSLLPKPGWCMLRKNFGRGASWALKPAWL